MSVAILKSPPPLSFSADFISTKFISTNFLSQVGAKAVNVLTGVANHAAGTIITIKYSNTTVIMTAANSPDDSGNQYLAYNPNFSVNIEIIASYFKANYHLSKDFIITVVAQDIVFTAKEKGHGYNFNSAFSGANTVIGLPDIKQPNYTTLFNLFLENAANTGYDLIYSTNAQLLPGTNGETEAIIGDKLHTVITNDIRTALPEQPKEVVIQCKNSCRRYYFEFAESFGDTITVKKLQTSTIFTVLHGGLSTLGQYQKTLLGLIAPNTQNNDRFLKQGENTILTRTNQPQYLYFFNTRGSKTVSVKTIFIFTDGAVHTETIAGVTLESYRKIAFDASFAFLYANPVLGKIVQSYTVYLLDGASQVSEQKTYVLDYALRNYIRYFLNWSSFGAIDTRLCYGKGESEYELTNQTAERIASLNQNIQYGTALIFDSKLKRSFKVATGWLNKADLQANADFFLSNLKYRFSKNVNLPIFIAPGKIPEIKDGEHLRSQIFEYKYQFDDHAYTEDDNEDNGFGVDGFYFNSGGGFTPAPGGTEVDPTVGDWIKTITPADIARWNASVGNGGATLGDWSNVLNLAAEITTENLKFQYKTDSPNDGNKVNTYIAGLFNLDAAFVGTSLLIGKLPDGSRPFDQLKEWFISGTTEIYLVIATNGDITLQSKDGFDLPTGTSDSAKYFINLNYKPKPAIAPVAGKWTVDAAGTSCEPNQTGYQINTLLKRVSDDTYEQPLDANDNYCTASGLAQATTATETTAPNYRIYNSVACQIPVGKWIIDTSYWRCDPANPGYRIFERMLRVSANVDENPYDNNDDICAQTGLPQATGTTPTTMAGYSEQNTSLCPVNGGGGGSDVDFELAQYGRRLKLSGPVAISCNIILTVNYYNVKREDGGAQISTTGPHTDTLNLNAGTNSVSSPTNISAGPYDTIEIISFSFSPKFCGSHQVFVNGQEGIQMSEPV